MIELTRTAGQKLLFEGKYEYAIPAAMQSLKFAIEVFGLSSIELVGEDEVSRFHIVALRFWRVIEILEGPVEFMELFLSPGGICHSGHLLQCLPEDVLLTS